MGKAGSDIQSYPNERVVTLAGSGEEVEVGNVDVRMIEDLAGRRRIEKDVDVMEVENVDVGKA